MSSSSPNNKATKRPLSFKALRFFVLASLAIGSTIFLPGIAQAQTNYFWAGGGTTNGLTATNNWFNAATGGTTSTPVSADATRLQFGTRTATLTSVNNPTAGFNVSGITFNSGVSDIYSFSITGSNFEYKKTGTTNPFITQNSVNNHSISGGFKLAEPTTLDGTGTGLVTLNGTWEGGTKGLIKNGSSAFLITGAATTVGTTTINGGTLALSGAGALGVIQLRGGVIAQTGTFSRALGTGATNVNLGAGGGGFAAYGGALTVSTNLGTWGTTANSLTTGTSLILGSSIANGVVTLNQALNLGGAARTIQLVDNVNSTADRSEISGIISNGSLAITGAGSLTLTATNSYAGTTTVGGGATLLVTGSLNAGSAVTVSSSGTLGGTGTVNGTIAATGSIAPGSATAAIGQLNSGAVTWNGAATSSANTDWKFNLGTSNSSDRLAITGNFNKGTGSKFWFNFLGSSEKGTFTLATWTGTTTFSTTDFDYTNLGGGLTGSFTLTNTVSTKQLQFTVIPEPSSALAAILLGVGLLRRRRA